MPMPNWSLSPSPIQPTPPNEITGANGRNSIRPIPMNPLTSPPSKALGSTSTESEAKRKRSSLPVEPYVDAQKASAFLGVAARTLNEMARTGVVPAYQWGLGNQRRTWRFKLSELDSYMKSKVGSSSRPPLPNRRSK
jgi:hypothetical protein